MDEAVWSDKMSAISRWSVLGEDSSYSEQRTRAVTLISDSTGRT
jgi:hypothetical protein